MRTYKKNDWSVSFLTYVTLPLCLSRADWAAKLKHWKDEFVSTLQHYWLGTKLLWADVRISSRLLVKLAGGKSLSRSERQQLTRTATDIFRLVPLAVFIIVPCMELCKFFSCIGRYGKFTENNSVNYHSNW